MTRAHSGIPSGAAMLSAIVSIVAIVAGAVETAAPQPAFTRGVDVRTDIAAPDSITVGERFGVRHTFVYPDSFNILVPQEIDPGTCRVLSLEWSHGRSKGLLERTAAFTLITLDLEEARLPEIAVEFHTPSGDTLIAFTDEVVIPVRRLAVEGEVARPLKDQWVAPKSYWKWVAGAVLLLAAAAVLAWWLRRRARRVEVALPEPKLPADYVALTELSRIEKMNLLRSGEFKRYYTLVTDAVRRYMEERFGVDAMERTTVELLEELEGRGRRVDKLGDLLSEADLVKFAKHAPTVESGSSAMASAREIVVKTADRVEAG